MLGDFHGEFNLALRVPNSQRIQDVRQFAGRKLRVHHRPLYLHDFTDSHSLYSISFEKIL